MIEPLFCNYNLDYQQRLGFLKLVSHYGDNVRGGPDEILRRLQGLFPEFRRQYQIMGAKKDLDINQLIFADVVPSWQVGFTPKRLDRLILWAQMVGIIASNGRLSEWATILRALSGSEGEDTNPFLISKPERAFFLHLLFYHDQILPILIRKLATVPSGQLIRISDACYFFVEALGDFYDSIKFNSPSEMKLRYEIRGILERIGKQYKITNVENLLNPRSRADEISALRAKESNPRNHLAEYHSVCRFEQLTDLGFFSKDDPAKVPTNADQKKRDRTSWSWYATKTSQDASVFLCTKYVDIESFLSRQWMAFSALLYSVSAKPLDTLDDQRTIARYLDSTVHLAQRQIGPIQLHSWATLACIRALSEGYAVELDQIYELLTLMHTDPDLGKSVRISGHETFRGRTVSIYKGKLFSLLQEYQLRER